MNNLVISLSFILILIILFWIMPNKKMKKITRNLKKLFQIFPISKLCEVFITIYDNKIKLFNNKTRIRKTK